jgi:spermidine synthase
MAGGRLRDGGVGRRDPQLLGRARMTVPRVELLHDLDRPTGRVLLVDGVEQSYVDIADPTHLEFEYMQHMAVAIDVTQPRPTALDALHLGGGALTMPRWLAATRPGSRHLVVEASPEVVTAIAVLEPVPDCELVASDVADVLGALPANAFDLAIWDLYDGPRAVLGALTMSAISDLRTALRDSGVAVLNISDVTPFDVVRPVVAALRACFADVAVLAEPTTLRGRRSGNCVAVASCSSDLPEQALRRRGAGATARARVVCGEQLDDFVGTAVPPTDESPLPLPDAKLGRGFL